ncbi:MAG: hypothetical protein Q8L26_08970 [Candidatus Omnitrophota bacterium]|nr:hypothetical protein [Candidatus Omnitrophota bacterium]
MVTYDEFRKTELKVAVIKEVTVHPDADKLYVLKIDTGGAEKQLVAGIRPYYLPEELIGRQVIIVDNLEPKAVRGVESQGMLLAASDDEGLSILIVDKPRKPGSIVK